MKFFYLFIGLYICGLHINAQAYLSPEWDGFQRSQGSVQNNTTYFAQNGRTDISILQSATERRIAVFSFDLSTLSAALEEVDLRLFNISTSPIQHKNLVLYAIKHELESFEAPTWFKLDLSGFFGEEVLTRTISDEDQNSWMSFSGNSLTKVANEARVAGKKLALILAYPEGINDGSTIKFENSTATNKPALFYSGGGTAAVTGISLSDTAEVLPVGTGYQLTAIVSPENAAIKRVIWSTSNEDVATVDDGFIKAISEGVAIITATTEDGDFTATFEAKVIEVAVSGVSLDDDNEEIPIGATFQLTATVLPENATNKKVLWSSDNEAVASVIDGDIKGLSEGKAIITARTEDGSFTATFQATVKRVPVTGVSLNDDAENFALGTLYTLTANIYPEEATNKNIIWSSSNEAVATVENGVVAALSEGKATITVRSEEGAFTDSFEATITEVSGTLSNKIDIQSPTDIQPLINEDRTEKFELVFSDEFNDSKINPFKWNVQDGFYRDRGEFILRAFDDQVEEREGHLFIYYQKDPSRANTYLAGRMDSRGKYAPTYGFLECRMHMVKPNGHQTAFWMMPEGNGMRVPDGVDGTANDGAEIDIIEGNKTNTFSCGLHWDGYGADRRSNGQSISMPGYHDEEYHTIGLEWTDTYLRFYFDGEVVREISNPILIPHVAQYLYFSGSMWGNSTWPDGNTLENEFIQNGGVDAAYLDYVRVYKLIDPVTNVKEPKEEHGFMIYPNPSSFELNFSKEVNNARIFSLSGKLLKSYQKVTQIDVMDLRSGLYLVEAQLKNGLIARKKLIVNRNN